MNLHDRDIIRAAKKEASYETAKNMLQMKIGTNEQIAKITGLTIDDIQNLEKESIATPNGV